MVEVTQIVSRKEEIRKRLRRIGDDKTVIGAQADTIAIMARIVSLLVNNKPVPKELADSIDAIAKSPHPIDQKGPMIVIAKEIAQKAMDAHEAFIDTSGKEKS